MHVKDIDFSKQFTRALELLESGNRSLFVTGHAGTGKSTLLDHFRNTTKKKIVVLAPTGVAALNVKGQTIHSFFGFRPGTTPQDIKKTYRNRGKKGFYKMLDSIVIDEISMVRADLLDCVNEFLKLHGPDPMLPFGGVRMIFIGDLYQLPPVVTRYEKELFNSFYESPYFFSAQVMKGFDLELLELDKIYRQDDKDFIEVLDGIRRNKLEKDQLELLNSSYEEDFSFNSQDLAIYLTTTNKKADEVNQNFLGKLNGKRHIFKGSRSGKFDKKVTPVNENLELKANAQVMLINNDRAGRWVNGSIGKISEIIELGSGKDIIVVELDDGSTIEVMPHTWEVFKFVYNPGTDQLQSESVGSYTQYPLILSWAITIHKSQGKTFNKAIIDFGWGTFAHGQAYVALSRCKSLEGMTLIKPFKQKDIITDVKIGQFFTDYQFSKNPWEFDNTEKLRLIKKAQDSGQLLKVKYYIQDEEPLKYMINPLEVLKNSTIKSYCHILGEEVLLNLDSILELEEIEGIN
jgi:ATP-dependent DNA helicase PIF1